MITSFDTAKFDKTLRKITNKCVVQSLAESNYKIDKYSDLKDFYNTSNFIRSYPTRENIDDIHRIINNFKYINELLIPILARQIGLDAVEYFPIRDTNKKCDVLLSQNMLRENENLVDSDLTLIGLDKSLSRLKGYTKSNTRQIRDSYFKLCILDLLTLQTDRNPKNLPLIVNDQEKYVRFGKVFDNEYAFNCIALENKELIENILTDKDYVSKIIDIYNSNLKDNKDTYYISASDVENPSFKSIAKDIVDFALYNKRFIEILNNTLESIDINSALDELKDKGIHPGKYYTKYVQNVFDYTKKYILALISKRSKEIYDNSLSK